MARNPSIQSKAQTELDTVVGHHRLPDFSDRPALPYVNAIVKECFRWPIVTPIGYPHKAYEDEELNGYLIPKGATLVANVRYVGDHSCAGVQHVRCKRISRAMSRDPAVYPDPEEFIPERFLNPHARDPMKFAFGFGRRYAPLLRRAYPKLSYFFKPGSTLAGISQIRHYSSLFQLSCIHSTSSLRSMETATQSN